VTRFRPRALAALAALSSCCGLISAPPVQAQEVVKIGFVGTAAAWCSRASRRRWPATRIALRA
jgi:hypothetical protein